MLSRRRMVLTAAMVLLPAAASADIVCALGTRTSAYKSASDQRPTPDTMQIVKRVNEAYKPVCLPRCPEVSIVRNSTAPNLMMMVSPDEAKIVYSPEFFAAVYGKDGDGGLIALIAHIYGHAIDDVTHQSWLRSSWNYELRADAWSGCVLAKTRLDSENLGGALAALMANPPPSQSAWSPRASAARAGFAHCGGEASKFDAALARLKKK